MNINRDNYETYFLLYIDHELSATEKKQVDEFVKVNLDLQEEFLMLKEIVLKPDNIVFNDKDSLYKKEGAPVQLVEKLMLHLDNELDKKEQADVEAMINGDAIIKKEWALLQQVKLSADDKIIFEDKASLYRRERRPVVAMPWFRMAAAAVFIGFAVWGGIAYFDAQQQLGSASVATTKPGKKTDIAAVVEDSGTKKPGEVESDDDANEEKLLANHTATVKDKPETTPSNEAHVQPVIKKVKTLPETLFVQAPVIERIPGNSPIKTNLENLNNNDGNKTNTAVVTPQRPNNFIMQPGKNEVRGQEQEQANSANAYATTAAFNESSETKSDDRFLFMDEEKIKKSKLGGIFRKVKRVLERNTNMKEDDNSLKVANLEFAIQ